MFRWRPRAKNAVKIQKNKHMRVVMRYSHHICHATISCHTVVTPWSRHGHEILNCCLYHLFSRPWVQSVRVMANSKQLLCLILSLFIAITSVLCQITIPKKPLGYVFNNGKWTAPINLEIYADLTCPDCQQSWPVVKQLAEAYGPDKLRLVFQTFPLPYHNNAFVAAQVFE